MEATPPQLLRNSRIAVFSIVFLLSDTVMYGLLIPVIGATIGSSISSFGDFGQFYEIMLVILSVVVLFWGFLTMAWEIRYWKNLFSLDKSYEMLLTFRDILNFGCLAFYISILLQAIAGIGQTGMKQCYLGEGLGFVFWNGLHELGVDVPETILKQYAWADATPSKPSFWSWIIQDSISGSQQQLQQIIHAGKLILAVAGITGTIIKFLYFNTLHTYTRCMKVFADMQDDAASPLQSLNSMTTLVSTYVSEFSLNVAAKKRNAGHQQKK